MFNLLSSLHISRDEKTVINYYIEYLKIFWPGMLPGDKTTDAIKVSDP